jgi:hypothetical protein
LGGCYFFIPDRSTPQNLIHLKSTPGAAHLGAPPPFFVGPPGRQLLAWWDSDLLREIVDHDWDAASNSGIPTISRLWRAGQRLCRSGCCTAAGVSKIAA